jgi:hypothetical protein
VTRKKYISIATTVVPPVEPKTPKTLMIQLDDDNKTIHVDPSDPGKQLTINNRLDDK